MSALAIGIHASQEWMGLSHEQRLALMQRMEADEIDHVFVGDHVSFHNGFGMDGLIDASSLAAMSSKLNVMVGVYLLALRHPVPVARQLSSISRSAPGRLTLGIGIGGEDRNELQMCGLDPARRGSATNHSLAALRRLMTGEPASYECDFFQFENAIIRPAPSPTIPLMIGGRSEAAVRRTAVHGDGWLGIWCSPKRFGQVAEQVSLFAANEGRNAEFRHGLQVWVGFGEKKQARQRLQETMQNMYQIPFEPFEKYSPYGSAEEVAAFLSPYVASGARLFNLAACGESPEHEIESVAEVKRLLCREHAHLTEGD